MVEAIETRKQERRLGGMKLEKKEEEIKEKINTPASP